MTRRPPRSRPALLISSVISCLWFIPLQASAQDETSFYVGAALEAIELDSFDRDGDVLFVEATSTAVIRGGVIFRKYFAVEAEAAIGLDNDEGDGIAGYDHRFAGYGRLRYPFGTTGLEAFARLGYATTSIDSRNIDNSNQSGVTYGGGLAFNFGREDRFQVRLDYTEFNFGEGRDADALSVGLGFNF